MATVPFFEGITASWLGLDELDELELLELLELLEPEGGGRHGGTIKVLTLLLAGSTSWSCGVAPAAEAPEAPPGVISKVFAGGGATAALLLELLELELLELEGDPHGSIATVSVSVLLGMVISSEPGGIELLPDCTTAASEHEVTASVSGLCCFGMTTVLTPGFWSAADTGSELLAPPLLLLPQPAIAATAAHVNSAATQRVAALRELLMLSSASRVDPRPVIFSRMRLVRDQAPLYTSVLPERRGS